ncbi:hypothetical protein ACSQ67_001839 [Phaseolus vulgaris]
MFHVEAQSVSGPLCKADTTPYQSKQSWIWILLRLLVQCDDDCEVVYGGVSKLAALFRANTVLQPGPLGIIEHKFSADEIRKANATVSKAVINWRRNAALEDNNHILKDYINK